MWYLYLTMSHIMASKMKNNSVFEEILLFIVVTLPETFLLRFPTHCISSHRSKVMSYTTQAYF